MTECFIVAMNPNLNTIDRWEVSPMYENAKLYSPIMLSETSYVETSLDK